MKIGIIGAGNVGASIAYALAMRGTCEQIALVDIFADVARAKAIDVSQAACVFTGESSAAGGDDSALLKGADVVIITAGSPRKEGQTREDLLLKNAVVVRSSAQNIAKFAPNAVIIVVTNPLDAMVWVAWEASGFDKTRVIGMAGELDSARCRFEAAAISGLKASEISAKVIGAHNDKMIVARQNVSAEFSADEFEILKQETANGGAKIVKLLGTSAYYAPAAGVVKICETIKAARNYETDAANACASYENSSAKTLCASVILGNELACGREIRLNSRGVSEILKPNLDAKEAENLAQSEAEISKNIKFLKENLR